MIGVAQLWATQDPTAAQAWMLSQPPGQARDTGLIAVIGASARFATPDASLLSAFSSEQTRIAAVQAAAFGIAQRDPDAASAFITANVADASQRDRLLSIVKQLPMRPGGGIGVSPPNSRRPDTAFGIGLQDKSPEIRNRAIDFVGLVFPVGDHAGIERIKRGEAADGSRTSEVH